MSVRRPRIITYTTLFPNPEDPLRGLFVRRRLAAVASLADITVVAPVNVGRNPRTLRVPFRRSDPPSLSVLHPRFAVLPGVFKEWDGALLHAQTMPQIRSALGTARYDLVDAHYAYPDGDAAARLADALRLPLVLTVRGSDLEVLPQHPLRRSRIAAVLRRADRIVAVSRSLERRAVALGAEPSRVRVIPNGIDPTIFRPMEREPARRDLGLSARDRLVLAVGHLDAIKGLDLLVGAMAALRARGRGGVACRILGEGPARTALQREIAMADLAGQVSLVGAVAPETLPLWYAAADCFCLLSRSEGCPNVVLEALACGRPVVATEVGGIPDLLREGVSGLYVRRREPAHVADVLEEALVREWRPAAIAASVQDRSWDAVAREQMAVYREVIA